jgi:ATP-dependent Clp protease adaptor protein ClpS
MTTEIIKEKKKQSNRNIKEPSKYKVIVCNDDVTPVDFVIALLISIFKHNPSTAETLTLTVHNEGSAVAGIYNFELAEQKVAESINLARSNGYPLIIKVEEA